MHTKFAIGLLGLVPLLLASGCTSMRSTALTRLDDGSLYSDLERPAKGVPLALKVPTHLEVEIVETFFWANNGATFAEANLPRPMIDVRTRVIETKQVFTVDFVRPAAGTLNTKLEFTDEQYLKSINNRIEDQTIKAIAESARALTPLLGSPKSAVSSGASLTNRLIVDERTLAFQRFDLNSPTFEQDVRAFLDLYINNCNDCKQTFPRLNASF